MAKKIKIVALIIWAICTALIIYGSVSKQVSVPETHHLDKLIHGGAYVGLAFLSFFFINNRKHQIAFLIMIIAMGGGIEIIQTFLPPRDGTIGDFAADSIGVFVGAFLARKIQPVVYNLLESKKYK